MESSPNDNDFDLGEEKDEDRPKRRASNGSDRAVAMPREGQRIEPFKSGQEEDGEKASLWRRLIGSEPQTAEAPKTSERTETESVAEASPEHVEAAPELPLTALSPDEEVLVLRRLVETGSLADDEKPQMQAEDSAVTEALDHFHDDILTGNKTLPEAFNSTLEWIDSGEESPGDDAEQAAGPLPEAVSGEPLANEASYDQAAPSQPGNPGAPVPPSERQSFGMYPNGPAHYAASPIENLPAAAPVAESVPGYDKSDVVGAALVGGLVGYLIGRRRGRIKTEKRLIPVQKKLEKQVKGLQQEIKQKESVIREKAEAFARERRRLTDPVRGPAERARERDALRAAAESNRSQPSDAKSREQPARGVTPQPEQQHIGQMVVTAVEALPLAAVGLAETKYAVSARAESMRTGGKEQPAFAAAEWASKPAGKARAEQAPLLPIDKHVETMSQKDLLELSSKIIIDGTTLKQAFESHQVGERALRRMVSEHLRGGDVREALRNEVMEHEIDFERDPQLRDQGHQEPKRSNKSGGGQGLQTMIQRAGVQMDGEDAEQTALLRTRATHQANQQAKQDRRHSQKHLVDVGMLGVIALLIGLIILLIIGHS